MKEIQEFVEFFGYESFVFHTEVMFLVQLYGDLVTGNRSHVSPLGFILFLISPSKPMFRIQTETEH